MADLNRLQNSQPVQLVDANDLQVCDITTVSPTGTESGLIVRSIPSGTQTVSGTITASPIGTYSITGTGTTAAPAAGILTVQGNANGISMPITLQNLNYPVSTANSSVAQLAAGATFTGTIETIQNQQAAQVQIYSNQPFTVIIDQFIDNTTTYPTSSDSFSVTNTGPLGGYQFNMNVYLPGNYFRLRVTNNGASTTTSLNINTTFGIMEPLPRTTDLSGDLRVNINGSPVTTSTVTQVTVSNSVSTTLAATNLNRTKVSIYNGGANNIYIKIGATASTTSYTLILLPGGLYEDPAPAYFGQIDAIANSAATIVNVTEV